jgi:hypothetical protein
MRRFESCRGTKQGKSKSSLVCPVSFLMKPASSTYISSTASLILQVVLHIVKQGFRNNPLMKARHMADGFVLTPISFQWILRRLMFRSHDRHQVEGNRDLPLTDVYPLSTSSLPAPPTRFV